LSGSSDEIAEDNEHTFNKSRF